jgi:hypothetical protein
MMNLLVLVVVSGSPTFAALAVKPKNVIAPAVAPLVTRMSIAQSLAGALIVCAPLLT